MASPAKNNSSSSPPIPCRPNPKPRNSEATDPMRRSFGGNPFPAKSRVNNPSDVSRSNSFGRENSRIEFSDKENETKALPTPKGSKNFMSPTISAVSKINASPRKKVLSDRNEMSRSSDFKGQILEDTKRQHQPKSCVSFSDVIDIIGIDEKKQFEESHDMTITDFDENEVYENNGIADFDSRFRISPCPSVPYASPEFAAPEVDPLLPPYDPKKNYLSPRPQFLHYRPNPRVEKPSDECKQLEELFISESSYSDSESEKCEEQEKDAVVVEEETEDAVVAEEDTEDVEQLEAESDEEMVCESIEETSQVPKQSGFRKFKFFGWFLALALGCMLVSATFSPSTQLSILKESSLTEFATQLSILKESTVSHLITEFVKANNFEQLSEKLWTLTESSLVYMDKLISRLGEGEEEYGPLQFYNLTDILEDYTLFKPTSVDINEVLPEKNRSESNLEDEDDVNEFEEEIGEEENTNAGDAETEFDEQTGVKSGKKIELNEGEGDFEALYEDGVEGNIQEQRESEVNPAEDTDARDSESQEKLETGSIKKDQEELEEAESESRGKESQERLETGSIQKEDQEKLEEAESESKGKESQERLETESTKKDQEKLEEAESELRGKEFQERLETESTKKDQEELEKTGFEAIYINQHDVVQQQIQSGESESEEIFGKIATETSDDLNHKVKSDNDLDKVMIIALSPTVLVLLAAVAFFLFTKKAKIVAASAPEQAPETTKELNLENLMKEKLLYSLNLEAEVDDRISKSFQKKSNNKDSKEHQSSSKLRRESMASSTSEYSIGSFSYGSFTTYEKIPIKSGDREEEIVTPVRRSSRLRNHNQSSSGL